MLWLRGRSELTRPREQILGFLVLHQLAPQNGVQIKWCLGWPDSPSGTTEYLLHNAIEHLVKEGVAKATFGAGAREKLLVVDNIKGFKAKVLSEVYSGIVVRFPVSSPGRHG